IACTATGGSRRWSFAAARCRQPGPCRRAAEQGRHPRRVATLPAGRRRPRPRPRPREGTQGRDLMRFLLDTNIIGIIATPTPSQSLISWMARQLDQDLFIASLTVAEI